MGPDPPLPTLDEVFKVQTTDELKGYILNGKSLRDAVKQFVEGDLLERIWTPSLKECLLGFK